MKFDKEFVTKHRFWVLLAVAVPLTLIVLLVLFFVAPSAARQKRDAAKKERKEIQDFKDLYNETIVKDATEIAKKRREQQNEVWEAAWSDQRTVMTWPK